MIFILTVTMLFAGAITLLSCVAGLIRNAMKDSRLVVIYLVTFLITLAALAVMGGIPIDMEVLFYPN